jgi:hypothetical protein
MAIVLLQIGVPLSFAIVRIRLIKVNFIVNKMMLLYLLIIIYH